MAWGEGDWKKGGKKNRNKGEWKNMGGLGAGTRKDPFQEG